MQTQLNRRGEHFVWKSWADGTHATVPPYTLQLLHVIATVGQQAGSGELKSEAFTSRTLAWVRLLMSLSLERALGGNLWTEALESGWAWTTPWQVSSPATCLSPGEPL